MEQVLGRLLRRDENVHHKDGNPMNNAIENLQLMSSCDHRILHMVKGDTKFGGHYKTKVPPSDDMAWCSSCKQFLPKTNFHKAEGRWNGVRVYCKKCRKDKSGITQIQSREEVI